MEYWLKFEIMRKKSEPSLFIAIIIKILIFFHQNPKNKTNEISSRSDFNH